MKLPKQNTKLSQHLNRLGILETGSEQEIKDAIIIYKRNYDKDLKHLKRNIEKRHFSISFPINQINHVRKRANDYGVDIICYIKLLVNADLSNTSPIEHTLAYKQVLQLLQFYKNTIEAIKEKDSHKWFGNNNYEELHQILDSIRNEIQIKKK